MDDFFFARLYECVQLFFSPYFFFFKLHLPEMDTFKNGYRGSVLECIAMSFHL